VLDNPKDIVPCEASPQPRLVACAPICLPYQPPRLVPRVCSSFNPHHEKHVLAARHLALALTPEMRLRLFFLSSHHGQHVLAAGQSEGHRSLFGEHVLAARHLALALTPDTRLRVFFLSPHHGQHVLAAGQSEGHRSLFGDDAAAAAGRPPRPDPGSPLYGRARSGSALCGTRRGPLPAAAAVAEGRNRKGLFRR